MLDVPALCEGNKLELEKRLRCVRVSIVSRYIPKNKGETNRPQSLSLAFWRLLELVRIVRTT